LSTAYHRSTFLPQVWEQLPDPADFLAHLKRKAGLSMDFWADQVCLSRYTVNKWKEAAA
jgi:AMMECR1 domain-containing protein